VVLVTGANGFIGQAACQALTTAGYQVRRAVRTLPDGGPAHAPVVGAAHDTCVVGDITAATDWSAALEGIDVVLHLAGRAHTMRETVPEPLTLYRAVNVAGTARLAQQAVEAGVRRLVFVSSIKVNGEITSPTRGYREDDPPDPQDAYGQSKWEAEQVLHQVATRTSLEVVIVRPPLVYGAGVRGNVLRLLKAIDRGVPLPLNAVQNRRSLIGRGNLVSALLATLHHPQAAGQTFLVSDGDDIATPELVRRLAHHMGRRVRLFTCPPALLFMLGRLSGQMAAVARLTGSLVVDSTKIRRTLEWTPPYTLDQGLQETVRWYQTRSG
jgi:nucleoside-diphosphate-sugar epimerase